MHLSKTRLMLMRKRSFDWEEAAQLRTGGMKYRAIAMRLKVSETTVRYAVDEQVRKRMLEQRSEWQKNGTCPLCRDTASRNGVKQYPCRKCSNDLKNGDMSRLGARIAEKYYEARRRNAGART